MLLQIQFSDFFEIVHLSPACNGSFNECDDWPFTDHVAMNGTKGNTVHEKHIDAKISQPFYVNYLETNGSHKVSHAANSTTNNSDSTNLYLLEF